MPNRKSNYVLVCLLLFFKERDMKFYILSKFFKFLKFHFYSFLFIFYYFVYQLNLSEESLCFEINSVSINKKSIAALRMCIIYLFVHRNINSNQRELHTIFRPHSGVRVKRLNIAEYFFAMPESEHRVRGTRRRASTIGGEGGGGDKR